VIAHSDRLLVLGVGGRHDARLKGYDVAHRTGSEMDLTCVKLYRCAKINIAPPRPHFSLCVQRTMSISGTKKNLKHGLKQLDRA
jgi:hypothetical protein